MAYVYEMYENCIKDQSKSLEEYARILVEYPETKKYFDDELLKKVEDEINRLLSNDQKFIDFVNCVECRRDSMEYTVEQNYFKRLYKQLKLTLKWKPSVDENGDPRVEKRNNFFVKYFFAD